MFRCTRLQHERAVAWLVAALVVHAGAAQAPSPDFDRDVRPILAAKCFACHGPDAEQRKADLRLDERRAALAAGAFVPGDPDASELVRRIEHHDAKKRMPPRRSGHVLEAKERATLRAWIAAGAEYQTHWAFVPPRRPALPALAGDTFVRNPIDAFVLAGMRAHGLDPSPEAGRPALLRRLSLDLLGLPPAPEEVAAFAGDSRADAYELVVERLLASPHYGEHMALPWLDAARYADSNGYQHDGDRQAWPWRDWLVLALNANRPLDAMVVDMLAGDLLPEPTPEQRVATALQRHHPVNNEGGAIADEVRFQYVVDRVHTFATVFLGLSVGCAQCHDHKFDPITQREYYQLFAFFDNVDEDGTVAATRRNTYHEFQDSKPYLELAQAGDRDALQAAHAAVRAAAEVYRGVEPALRQALTAWLRAADDNTLATLPAAIALLVRKQRGAPLGGAQARRLRSYFATTETQNAAWAGAQRDLDRAETNLASLHEGLPVVMVMQERAERRPTRVHARGAYDQAIGDPLPPAVPAVLGSLPDDAPRDRLGLARWLVAAGNPLFARVFVNRAWQAFFGRGLVPTPEDFGATGERPSHPELLDWLAVEFIASGFDVKRLHRLIVTSATYRQSSVVTPAQAQVDPSAIWLARSPRYRLSSFALRDQALAAAGLLDRRLGGPPVFPYHPAGLWLDVSFEVFDYPDQRANEQHRRSLYTFWRRTVGPPTLFDAANRQTCVVRPSRTNTPLQALVLLNDPTYVEAARALAQRVLREANDGDARLVRMFTLATARPPADDERATLRAAYQRERARFAHDSASARQLVGVGVAPVPAATDVCELAAWTSVAQLVLNLDEVLTRP